jgi:hypothetical protein
MYNTDIPSRAELPTSRQLLRSTLIAAVAAIVILLTAVLPGEYGIDPTGIGRPLGLTRMGEIKRELAREAAADRVPPSLTAPAPAQSQATPLMRAAVMSVVLEPGAGIEIKLAMKKGAKAQFEWTATGGALNCDTHGEPDDAPGKTHYYKRSSGVAGDNGNIEAAFDGNHGWFWRNRNPGAVTVTVRAFGEFSAMKRVM